jgi:hypothetical protein
VWLIDNCVLDLVAQAMAQGHAITACPACGGPLVHSLADQAVALCLRCGHRIGGAGCRCWACGAAIQVVPVPPGLALEAANSRADLAALSAYVTCPACGGQATAPKAGRGLRHCTVCKAELIGKARGRALDLCEACRGRRRRQQNREAGRKRRESGRQQIAP